MKAKHSRWASILLSSVLILQLVAIQPASAESTADEVDNKPAYTTLHDKSKNENDLNVENGDDVKEEEVGHTEKEKPPDKNKGENSIKEPVEEVDTDIIKDEMDNSEGETVDSEEMTEEESEEIEIPEIYAEHKALLEKAKKEFSTVMTLEAGMTYAVLLAALPIEGKYAFDSDKEEFIMEHIKRFLNENDDQILLNPKEEREMNEALTKLLFEQAVETKDIYEALYAKRIAEILPPSEENLNLREEIEKLIESLKLIVEDQITDTGEKSDDLIFDDNISDSQLNRPPGYGSGGKPNKPVVIPEANYTHTKNRFFSSNGVCMKETQFMYGNKTVKRTTAKASSLETTFCMGNASPNKDVEQRRKANQTFTGYDPYDTAQRLAYAKEQKEKQQAEDGEEIEAEVMDGLTIQYTFDKNADSPYYYDTGIEVNEKRTISYDQAKNALHIISVQAKGRYVEDKDQVLDLVDGQIIRIHEFEDQIPFADFSRSFDMTDVGVRALDTRSGTQQEIADLIEIKRIASIIVNGEAIKLDTHLIVDNNYALFPAEQFAELIGAVAVVEDDSLFISLDSTIYGYIVDSSTVAVNEKEVSIGVPARLNEKGIFMIPVEELLNATGFVLTVENEELHFETIK